MLHRYMSNHILSHACRTNRAYLKRNESQPLEKAQKGQTNFNQKPIEGLYGQKKI